MNIPKIIHQIWMQGYENISDINKEKIKNTKNIHYNWIYILWDDKKIEELLNAENNIEYITKYNKFIYMHQKIDFAKILILKNYGGIYIDIDCDVIKNLNDLFEKINGYDFIISKLYTNNDIISNYIICHKFNECYNNGIIVSKANIEICSYLMDNFLYECQCYEIKLSCIQNTTGPPIFNTIIDKYIKNNHNNDNKNKILFLPYYYFEPCSEPKCKINENTYIVHKHELSWLSESQKKIFNFVLCYINLTYLLLLIIILIFIVLIFINYI